MAQTYGNAHFGIRRNLTICVLFCYRKIEGQRFKDDRKCLNEINKEICTEDTEIRRGGDLTKGKTVGGGWLARSGQLYGAMHGPTGCSGGGGKRSDEFHG